MFEAHATPDAEAAMQNISQTQPAKEPLPSKQAYIFFFLLALAVIVAFSRLLYKEIKRGFINETRNHAQYAAVCVAASINAYDLDAVHTPEDADSDLYRRLQNILIKYKRAATDIRFIYIMRRSQHPGALPGDYEYVVDQIEEDENGNGVIDPDEASELPGTFYNAAALPAMIRAWDHPDADPNVAPDPPYGHSISGYAPIRDANGKTVAILGVDIADTTLYAKFKNSSLMIAAFVLIVAVLLGTVAIAHYKIKAACLLITAKNEDLAKSAQRTMALMNTRNELSRMIMHDIRSPLSVILGNVSLLLNDTAAFSAQDTNEILETIQNQADRIKTFLEDMLLLAKSESDRLVLNKEPTDLRNLALRELETHQVLARLAKVSLRANIPESLPQVFVDSDLITRLMDNLISNAIKFSPLNGTVILRVEHRTQQLPGSAGCLELSVSDEGVGVPPEMRDMLFKKFSTIANFPQHSKQIGLGLVFCKMVIESHNGRLHIKDNHPRGAILIAEIPITEPAV